MRRLCWLLALVAFQALAAQGRPGTPHSLARHPAVSSSPAAVPSSTDSVPAHRASAEHDNAAPVVDAGHRRSVRTSSDWRTRRRRSEGVSGAVLTGVVVVGALLVVLLVGGIVTCVARMRRSGGGGSRRGASGDVSKPPEFLPQPGRPRGQRRPPPRPRVRRSSYAAELYQPPDALPPRVRTPQGPRAPPSRASRGARARIEPGFLAANTAAAAAALATEPASPCTSDAPSDESSMHVYVASGHARSSGPPRGETAAAQPPRALSVASLGIREGECSVLSECSSSSGSGRDSPGAVPTADADSAALPGVRLGAAAARHGAFNADSVFGAPAAPHASAAGPADAAGGADDASARIEGVWHFSAL